MARCISLRISIEIVYYLYPISLVFKLKSLVVKSHIPVRGQDDLMLASLVKVMLL